MFLKNVWFAIFQLRNHTGPAFRILSFALLILPSALVALSEWVPKFTIALSFLESSLLGICLVLLFWLYQLAKIARHMDDALTPELVLRDPVVELESDGDDVERVGIDIENRGNSMLNDCLIKLTEISGVSDEDKRFLNLPSALKTDKRAKSGGPSNFTLRPNERKRFGAARFWTGGENIQIQSEEKLIDAPINTRIVMEIVAYSNGPSSAPLKIEIWVADRHLQCRKI